MVPLLNHEAHVPVMNMKSSSQPNTLKSVSYTHLAIITRRNLICVYFICKSIASFSCDVKVFVISLLIKIVKNYHNNFTSLLKSISLFGWMWKCWFYIENCQTLGYFILLIIIVNTMS